jgi:hypothetical protein
VKKSSGFVILSPFAVILSGAKNLRSSFAQGKLREGSRQLVRGIRARKKTEEILRPQKAAGSE